MSFSTLSSTDSSDSDAEDALLLLAAKSASRKRKIWVHDINLKRSRYGEFHVLCRELESDEDKFYTYFRMTKPAFDELHSMLEPHIIKQYTHWREPIGTKERLAICLRYLATGDSFQTIALSFRVGRSTVGNIVEQVCKAIWNTLQPIYLPSPSEETWKEAEEGYRNLWRFPNCLGSIDGKHVAIKCPKNSGSNFYCYKHFFSIVLLAVVDPFYKFIVVDIGSCGRFSDSGIFENSAFYREFIKDKTLLPPKSLPGTNDPVPHVLIGDEGFALQPYLMRPFPKAAALHDEKIRNYNKRLCSARRVVENAFGILAEKWRIFHRPMGCSVETAEEVVKATCCLHNFIRTKEANMREISNESSSSFMTNSTNTLPPPSNQTPSHESFQIRNKFVAYFENN